MLRSALIVVLATLGSAQNCPEIVTACQDKTNVSDKLLCFAQPDAMDCAAGMLDDSVQTLVDCAKDAVTLCADSEETLSFCLENNFMLLSPACAAHVNPQADPADADSVTDEDPPDDVDPVYPAVDPVVDDSHHHSDDLKEDHRSSKEHSSHHSYSFSWKHVLAPVALVLVFSCCVRRCRMRRMQRMRECEERHRAAAAVQQPITVVASASAPAHAVYPTAPIPYATLVHQPLVQQPLQSVPMQGMPPVRQPSNTMYPSLDQRHFYGLLNQA